MGDCLSNEIAGWCVVISKPMAEQVAAKNLRQAGYREYLPMQRRFLTGHRKGRGELVMRPLFSRYLFAELHPSQQWTPIIRSIGVADMIWREQRPALLTNDVVQAIMDAEKAAEFDEKRYGHNLEPGMTVRVNSGPFQTHIGRIITAASDSARVAVLLNILGGAPTWIDGRELEVVSSC